MFRLHRSSSAKKNCFLADEDLGGRNVLLLTPGHEKCSNMIKRKLTVVVPVQYRSKKIVLLHCSEAVNDDEAQLNYN